MHFVELSEEDVNMADSVSINTGPDSIIYILSW